MLRKILAVTALFAALVATPVFAQTATADPVVAQSVIAAPSSVAVGAEFTATLTLSSTVPFAAAEFSVSTSEGITLVSAGTETGLTVRNGGLIAWIAPATEKVHAMQIMFHFRANGSGAQQVSFSEVALDEGGLVAEATSANITITTMVLRAGIVTYGPWGQAVPVEGVVVTSTTSAVSATTDSTGAYSMYLPFDASFRTALRYSKSGDEQGAVTVGDALIILRCVLGLTVENGACSPVVTDVTADGTVSALDAWHTLRFVAGYRGETQAGAWFFSANGLFGAPITHDSVLTNSATLFNSVAWVIADANYSRGTTPSVVAADAACSTAGISLTPSNGEGEYLLTGVTASSVMIDLGGVSVQDVTAEGWMTADHDDKIAMVAGSGEPTALNIKFTIAPEQGVTELDAHVIIDECPALELSSVRGVIEPANPTMVFMPLAKR